MDTTEIMEIIGQLQDAFASGQWYALAAAAVMLGIRIVRIGQFQNMLPANMRWDNLKTWVRYVIVFLASVVAAVFTGLASGVALKAALSAAIIHALSTLMHKGTQAIGQKSIQNKVDKEPLYEPSAFRTASSLILPFDESKIVRKEISDSNAG